MFALASKTTAVEPLAAEFNASLETVCGLFKVIAPVACTAKLVTVIAAVDETVEPVIIFRVLSSAVVPVASAVRVISALKVTAPAVAEPILRNLACNLGKSAAFSARNPLDATPMRIARAELKLAISIAPVAAVFCAAKLAPAGKPTFAEAEAPKLTVSVVTKMSESRAVVAVDVWV